MTNDELGMVMQSDGPSLKAPGCTGEWRRVVQKCHCWGREKASPPLPTSLRDWEAVFLGTGQASA